jgi:hypothetical protein
VTLAVALWRSLRFAYRLPALHVSIETVYNWKTDARWAGTCRQLIVTLDDGTSHRANFNFVK